MQLIDNAVDMFSVEYEEGGSALFFVRGDVSQVDDSKCVHERYNVSPCLVPRIFR